MDPEAESWINTPAFDWTPEAPLRLEPKFSEAVTAEAEIQEPRFENPQLPEPLTMPTPASEWRPPQPKKPASKRVAKPRFTPARKERELFKASPALARMATGMAQGFGLFALFQLQGVMDPFVFSGALMVLLFAPLLLLAGLGRMRFAPLLVWTIFAGGLLAAVGAYHHWRIQASVSGHPGLVLLALTGLFLFVAQSIVQAKVDDYGSYYRSAWRLSIRIVLCALFAGLCWAAAGAGVGFMREHYPALQFSPLIIPLVAMGAALAAQLTGERFLGALQEGLMFVFVLALPLLVLAAAAVAGLGAPGFWRPSLAFIFTLGMLLIVAINASYRDGTVWRSYWRRRSEFAGALVLVPLAMLAALALAARVQEYGWTDSRIFAVAGVLLLSGYALLYAGVALISLGGGGWMQRIEGSNIALAFSGLMLIAVMASPVADPARLAVETQSFRLEQHKVAAEAFDFNWLRDGGLRFGHDALARMAAMKNAPTTARGAYMALAAPPQAVRPTPTEIGANIRVHSKTGMPAGLLARDWSGVDGAPPCLTGASPICDAFFADLDGDGRDEILLAYGSDAHWWASVMKEGAGGGWYVAGTLAAPPCPGSLTALRQGHFQAVRPANNWRDLLVDGLRLSVNPPKMPMACPRA